MVGHDPPNMSRPADDASCGLEKGGRGQSSAGGEHGRLLSLIQVYSVAIRLLALVFCSTVEGSGSKTGRRDGLPCPGSSILRRHMRSCYALRFQVHCEHAFCRQLLVLLRCPFFIAPANSLSLWTVDIAACSTCRVCLFCVKISQHHTPGSEYVKLFACVFV